MEPETKEHLSDRTIWVRILYMLFFAIAYSIAEFLVAVIAVVQAIVVLVTGSVNKGLHVFGKNLSIYIAQILHFQTFNSEELAFPFSEWPDEAPDETQWSENSAPTVNTTAPQRSEPDSAPAEDVSAEEAPAAEAEPTEPTADDSDQDDGPKPA